MVHLVGLMISIGLADSLNPTTIAPALYLASGPRPRRRVAEFTLAVFFVYLVGGVLIALGPGELILDLVPHPHRTARHIAEIVAGVLLLISAVIIWRRRERIARRGLPQAKRGKSSALLGATITAVELPTAFPYFAAIAAVVGAGLNRGQEIGLLLIFNLCFVAPLLGILATLIFAGSHAQRALRLGRLFLERFWPHLLAVLIALVGAVAILIGASGLVAAGHGSLSRLIRHIRQHIFHLRS